jgi:cytosine deaminase
MLVLSRRRNQAIMIGNDVEITVVDFRGDKVRIGIRAPDSVSVHRREVWEAIRDENKKAAELQPQDLEPDAAGSGGPAISMPSRSATAVVDSEQSKQRQTMGIEVDQFLKAAIDEARLGLAEGGLPIGSVLVRNGKIIARGHNRRVQRNDPMAHAEIDCLTNAGRQRTYKDTVLYSTLMPCYLCSGAVVQFGIPKVIVGESVNFGGGPEFMRSKGVEVIDLHDQQCIQMMGQFIRDHPELWNEDIGK